MEKIFAICGLIAFIGFIIVSVPMKVANTNEQLFWGIMCLFHLVSHSLCKIERIIEMMQKQSTINQLEKSK